MLNLHSRTTKQVWASNIDLSGYRAVYSGGHHVVMCNGVNHLIDASNGTAHKPTEPLICLSKESKDGPYKLIPRQCDCEKYK
jgi:hypothetical protein